MQAFQSRNLAKKTTYLPRAMMILQQTMLVVQMTTKLLLLVQLTQLLQLLVLQSKLSMLNAHQGIQGNTNGRT